MSDSAITDRQVSKASSASYDTDFYAWAIEQAALLRAGHLQALDIDHLIEELEGLAARDRKELLNRLRVLLIHLLKWQHQPTHRTKSWRSTINTQRDEIDVLLQTSPSLRPRLDEFIVSAYVKARRSAADETGLAPAVFPVECAYTLTQILNSDWWPDDKPK